MMQQLQRKYDVVVYGATGFTGALVAQYLSVRPDSSNLRWAVAGRDQPKLQVLLNTLPNQGKGVDIIVANASSQESLDSMAKQTKVVLTTVGPYHQYGTPLVDSCVRMGTHYCDLTGEVPWIKTIINKYHKQAQENKAMIVTCSGFDSIPSDLGALMVIRHMKTKYGRDCGDLKYLIGPFKGGASGGTLASLFGMMELPASTIKEMRDPFYLNDDGKKGAPNQREQMNVRYDSDIQKWTAPFVMAACNTRVVRRSASLLGDYGENFRYSESVVCSSWFSAFAMWSGLFIFMVLASISFTRNLLKKVLPKPGEGPNEKQRKEGMFQITFVGKSEPKDGEQPVEVRGQVNGYGDPGYQETSKMIAETAIFLSQKSPDTIRGGVMTPASALGLPLIDRLRTAGMTFDITKG